MEVFVVETTPNDVKPGEMWICNSPRELDSLLRKLKHSGRKFVQWQM